MSNYEFVIVGIFFLQLIRIATNNPMTWNISRVVGFFVTYVMAPSDFLSPQKLRLRAWGGGAGVSNKDKKNLIYQHL